MQSDEFVAEGPIGNTLHVRFPVSRYGCGPRAWEGGQGVEVTIVDDNVCHIRDGARERDRDQGLCSEVANGLHRV